MLKSTKAMCEYSIMVFIYTTGYTTSRASICIVACYGNVSFSSFSSFSWFSLLSVVLSESVACRRRCRNGRRRRRRWRRRRRQRWRQHQHHFCRWWMQRMHACSARWAWRLPSTTASYSGALCSQPSAHPPRFLLPGRRLRPLVRQRSSYANLLATVSRCFIKSCPKTTQAKAKAKAKAMHSG